MYVTALAVLFLIKFTESQNTQVFYNGAAVSLHEIQSNFPQRHQGDVGPEYSMQLASLKSIAIYKIWDLFTPQNFLVFQTADNMWWSLEKKPGGIILQKATSKVDVVEYGYNNLTRGYVTVVKEDCDTSDKTMLDVVSLIETDNFVFHGYDLQYNNCKAFSKFIFDKFAKVQTVDFDQVLDEPIAQIKDILLLKSVTAPIYGWATKQEWQGLMFCDKSPDITNGQVLCKKDKLKTILYNLYGQGKTNGNVKISKIAVYKCPLEGIYSSSPEMVKGVVGRQWTSVDYHAFVVFQTNDEHSSWWSLEKNQEGIFLETGRSREFVKNNFHSHPRKTPVELLVEDDAQYDLEHLFSFLENFSTSGYDAIHSSCQHLARKVFDKAALTKSWEFITPAEYLSLITFVEFLRTLCSKKIVILSTVCVIVVALFYKSYYRF